MTSDRSLPDRDRVLEQLRTVQRLRRQSFSNHAVDALVNRQTQYLADVSQEATRIARRNQSDMVSAVDVERAERNLHQSAAGGARLAETLGAAVFGAGLSEFVAEMTSSHPGHLGIGLGCGGMVLGLAWIAFRRPRGN